MFNISYKLALSELYVMSGDLIGQPKLRCNLTFLHSERAPCSH